jgi:hypothetical protein
LTAGEGSSGEAATAGDSVGAGLDGASTRASGLAAGTSDGMVAAPHPDGIRSRPTTATPARPAVAHANVYERPCGGDGSGAVAAAIKSAMSISGSAASTKLAEFGVV